MTDDTRRPAGSRPSGSHSANGHRPNGQRRVNGAPGSRTGRPAGQGRVNGASRPGATGTRSTSANGGTRRPAGQGRPTGAAHTSAAGHTYTGEEHERTHSQAQHRRPASKRQTEKKRRRNLLIAEISLLALLLIVLLVYLKFSSVIEVDNTIDDKAILDEVEQQVTPEALETLKGYKNIALFGVDDRKSGAYSNRSDSIIIASINEDTSDVKLVSVYRDTYLDVGGGNYNKCNAAYSSGGPEQSIAMLNRNLDLNITDYVAVDFYALVKAIDAVGGIDLDITEEEAMIMNWHSGIPGDIGYIEELVEVVYGSSADPTQYFVDTGHIHANGIQATAYCRIRYTAGDDFKRASRQREVLSKLIDKAKSADVKELNDLINSMYGNVKTSLSISEMLSYASKAKEYNLVDTSGFPFDKSTGTYGGNSLVVPCTLESNVVKLYEYLFDDTTYVPSQTVKDHSDYIVNYTGCTEDSANTYQDYEY